MTSDGFSSRISDLLDLDKLGLPLSPEVLSEVKTAGAGDLLAIKSLKASREEEEIDIEGVYDGRKHLWLYHTPSGRGKGTKYEEPNYYDRIPEEWKTEWKDKEIKRSDWLPDGAPRKLDPELRQFLISCNPRFDRLIPYKRFWLYCEQARRWSVELTKIEKLEGRAQVEYAFQEFGRSRQNKLYGLDKYATIKDEASDGGRRDYKASAPQALLLFLKDCGYSYILLKGRQAAITSTMMAAAQLTALVTPSYKGALVADKEKTVTGIFNDKFKSTLQHMPDWWQPDTRGMLWSDRRVVIDFDPAGPKAEKRKFSSELQTYGSNESQTLNSNTPTETYFDEAQKIPTLQEILKEIKPTMRAATADGLKVLRSCYCWGTGGTGDAGKGAFEGEFRTALGVLEDTSKDRIFLLPIFFDAFCRPYMDQWTYLEEYKDYMAGTEEFLKGMSPEENKAVFGAHYPMSMEDCFMAGTRTVVPQSVIKKQRDRIQTLCHPYEHIKPKKGRFKPIFDYKQPMPHGSWLPYRVIGAEFEHLPNADFHLAPATMFIPYDPGQQPDRTFVHRFFQGTDPIQADTGSSRMGSAIWDAASVSEVRNGTKVYVPTVACTINHRAIDVKDTFLQCVLMGMYYRNHGQTKCMELIEYEQGHNYIDFQKQPFIMTEESMLMRGHLPPQYAGGGHIYGISMKKERKTRAHIDLSELIYDHGANIYHIEFWNQLSNIESEERPDRSIDWGTRDPLAHKDDLVFGVLYAYLAWKSVGEKPKKLGTEDAPERELQMVCVRDGNDQLRWEEQLMEVDYTP